MRLEAIEGGGTGGSLRAFFTFRLEGESRRVHKMEKRLDDSKRVLSYSKRESELRAGVSNGKMLDHPRFLAEPRKGSARRGERKEMQLATLIAQPKGGRSSAEVSYPRSSAEREERGKESETAGLNARRSPRIA